MKILDLPSNTHASMAQRGDDVNIAIFAILCS